VADPVNQDVKEYLNYVCTSEGLEKSILVGNVL
jgi:hypothetical protein